MSRIRALLADDEPLARQRLVGLLEREGDVDVVATCADGREALEHIRREEPDLVFLDIHMPELSGVEVARRVVDDVAPAVVFVTAYDRHAIEAFDLNALDYLLKPYCRDRFGRCMDRVRQRLRDAPQPDLAERLQALLHGADRSERRLELKDGADIVYLSVGEVDWVESAGNYVVVHSGGVTHLERATMSEMQLRLGDAGFLRCHRSAIVNTRRVRSLHTPSTGELHITLSTGERVPLSRRYVDALRGALCEG